MKKSRRQVCIYCMRVGARVIVALGWAHSRCLDEIARDTNTRKKSTTTTTKKSTTKP